MEIRLLRYFWTIAEEGTVSRAAEVMHMTQPTLSRQLKALEEELGTPLFARDGKRLALTDAGMLLKTRAEEILALTEATVREFSQRKQDLFSGTIAIGCVEADNSDTMAVMLEEMVSDYPQVKFNIFTGTGDIIRDRLDKGLLDLGILLEPVEMGKYDKIVLPRTERWGLVTSVDSFLATKKVIRPADVRGIPLVMSPRPEVQRMVSTWMGQNFAELNVIGTFNLMFNVLAIIANQAASTFTIEGAVKNRGGDEVVFIPAEPEIQTNCVLVWRQGRTMTPVVREFVHRFREAFGKQNE